MNTVPRSNAAGTRCSTFIRLSHRQVWYRYVIIDIVISPYVGWYKACEHIWMLVCMQYFCSRKPRCSQGDVQLLNPFMQAISETQIMVSATLWFVRVVFSAIVDYFIHVQ